MGILYLLQAISFHMVPKIVSSEKYDLYLRVANMSLTDYHFRLWCFRCFRHFTNQPQCMLSTNEDICNSAVLCAGLHQCDVNCPSVYQCSDERCVRRETICSGEIYDGCPEDDEWGTGIGFKCIRNGNVCLLPQQLLYDDIQDCDGKEDLCFSQNQKDLVAQKR